MTDLTTRPALSGLSAALPAEVLNDKVRGCWLGKSIGGTLGAPHEGLMQLLDVQAYPPLSGSALPNDDLDLQLLWLSVLERCGLATHSHVLARAWLDHVHFPYGEYGYAIRNLRRGLLPPLSGAFDNPFTDGMGSPIRSEIWAIAALGKPHLAAALAYEDACVDHAGEGIWGAMLFAALEAAAFECSDPDTLLDLALKLIPAQSRMARAVQGVRRDHRSGLGWRECRESVLRDFGHADDFTDAPQNVAFAVLGWLYGQDFSDSLKITVNCGYDTDSSGAMVGALLGILHGAAQIPQRWTQPLGERIVVSPEVGGFAFPQTLEALTRRSLDVTRLIDLHFRADTPLARDMQQRASLPGLQALWTRSAHQVQWRSVYQAATSSGLDITVNYPEGPAARPGLALPLSVSLINQSDWPWEGELRWFSPEGWTATGGAAVQLDPGETLEVPLSLTPDETSGTRSGPFAAQLELLELQAGSVWQRKTYPVGVTFLREWQLTVDDVPAQSIWLPGGQVVLPAGLRGNLRARLEIKLPQARPVRLVVMGHAPVEVWLDGAHLFTTDGQAPLFASPHITRHEGFEACYRDTLLDVGPHQLELHFFSHLPDGRPHQPDFRLAGMQEPLYHHFVDVAGI